MNRHPFHNNGKAAGGKGFTLIELLVVISIIALMVAVLLPAIERSRLTARQVLCGSQVRQIGFCRLSYSSEHDGWFPLTHHVAQAGIGAVTGEPDPLHYYFGSNEEFLICPDTQWLGSQPIGTHPYGPSYWGQPYGSNKFRWTAYRFTTAHGTWGYGGAIFGLHPTRSSASGSDYHVSPTIPNFEFAGRVVEDPDTGERFYVHKPSEMPSVFDGRSTDNTPWRPYTTSLGSRFTSNHYRLNGMNIGFLDGHVSWVDQPGQSDRQFRLQIYNGGYIYWD